MVLADNTQGTVFAVDHWKGSEEHQGALADKPDYFLYGVFSKNLQRHIDYGRVVPIRMPSVEAAAHLARQEFLFDMVFIDASHDYDSVKADILAWKPLISPGGILCGHDAGHPPIMRATHELLPVRHEHSMWVVEL